MLSSLARDICSLTWAQLPKYIYWTIDWWKSVSEYLICIFKYPYGRISVVTYLLLLSLVVEIHVGMYFYICNQKLMAYHQLIDTSLPLPMLK